MSKTYVLTLVGCLLVAFNCQEIKSQDVLYDNLDNVQFDNDWLTANGRDIRFAQHSPTRTSATPTWTASSTRAISPLFSKLANTKTTSR